MGIDAASNAILSAVTSSSTGAQIGIDLLKSTESNQAQNIATLFSSIGIGGNVSALA